VTTVWRIFPLACQRWVSGSDRAEERNDGWHSLASWHGDTRTVEGTAGRLWAAEKDKGGLLVPFIAVL